MSGWVSKIKKDKLLSVNDTIFGDKMLTEKLNSYWMYFSGSNFFNFKMKTTKCTKQQKYSIRAGEEVCFSSTETGPWATEQDLKGTLEICARCSLHNFKTPKILSADIL